MTSPAEAQMFCADPTPEAFEKRSICILTPGHNAKPTGPNHLDRDGNRWIVSQSTIDEAARISRAADERSQQDMLRRDLREKYIAPAVPESVSDDLFAYCWEQGHSAGAYEVEMHYADLKDIVNRAHRAGRQYAVEHGR